MAAKKKTGSPSSPTRKAESLRSSSVDSSTKKTPKKSSSIQPSVAPKKKVVGSAVKKVVAKKAAGKKATGKKAAVSPRSSRQLGLETVTRDVETPLQASAPDSSSSLEGIRLLTDSEVKAELGARWTELSKQRTHAEELLARYADYLKSLPEVRGFHVGLWKKQDQVVSPLEYCICVHVVEKLQRGDARLENPLPPRFEGIRIDVIQQSYKTTKGLREELNADPILGGIAIANTALLPSFGTLGLCVFSKIADLQPRYLTNQHVVGNRGDIVQPPIGGSVIGQVIDSERNELLDAALIEPKGNRTFDVGLMGSNGKRLRASLIPGSLNVTDEKNSQCFLIGAMSGTGKEFGVVESINTRIHIEDFGWMDKQIVVNRAPGSTSSLIEKGDSGAVLVKRFTLRNRESFMVVGLVHSMTDSGGIVASHLKPILERFAIGLSDIDPL